jgi:hypothetical protein
VDIEATAPPLECLQLPRGQLARSRLAELDPGNDADYEPVAGIPEIGEHHVRTWAKRPGVFTK